MSKKKNNPFAVYATASQLAFTIITPLLIFIVGGYYACKHFGWPDWAMGLCVALGIIFMLGGGISYLGKLIKMYGKDNKDAPRSYNSPSDNDYYDEYRNLHK
ncbi:MAG: AtpZ/AtpI family protein [Oscillospiraceae bacterium]|nr:AtpZ/AtpI family protein [Oscillospiraceae bacterium]